MVDDVGCQRSPCGRACVWPGALRYVLKHSAGSINLDFMIRVLICGHRRYVLQGGKDRASAAWRHTGCLSAPTSCQVLRTRHAARLV